MLRGYEGKYFVFRHIQQAIILGCLLLLGAKRTVQLFHIPTLPFKANFTFAIISKQNVIEQKW